MRYFRSPASERQCRRRTTGLLKRSSDRPSTFASAPGPHGPIPFTAEMRQQGVEAIRRQANARAQDPVRLRRRERERHRESAQRARPAVPAWRQVDRAIDHQRPRSAPSQARLTRPTSTSAGPRQSSTVGPTYGSETGRTSNIASPAWSRSTTASSTKFFSSPAGPKRAGSVTVGSNTRRSAGGPSFHWAIGKEPGSCR